MVRGSNHIRQMGRLALILFAVLASKALGHAGEPGASKDLMEVARHLWGQYSVVVYKTKDEWGEENRRVVEIRDRSGKVLREIRSPGIGSILDVGFREITGGGDPELYVKTTTGGMHCCYTEYYFTKDKGLRNLLIFFGGNRGIRELRDLNGDGRPELIAESDVLAYFDDLSHGESPVVVMVIGWDGKRYVDQTRRYPTIARKQAQKYRNELKEGYRGAALGYYANMLVIGEGTAARAWLLKHADKDTRQWLFNHEHEEELRVALAAYKRKICMSQEQALAFGDVAEVCPNGGH